MKSLRDRGSASAAPDRLAKASCAHRPADLPVGEQFVLWALRQWHCELRAWERDGAFPVEQSHLRDRFRIAGLLEALPEFAMAMDVLLLGVGRALEIHQPCCSAISRDEIVFIALCGLAQADLGAPLAASLNAMLSPDAAEAVGARLTLFAAMLADAGLALAPRQGDAGRRLH